MPVAARTWVASLGLVAALFLSPAAAAGAPKAYLLDLQGTVGPVVADYVVLGLREAADQGATSVVLRVDTPGGLDSSMRDIIRAILASPIPVIGYVAPSGARAASAGTYIIYASHVAAMAPGTNIGAATPINLFGGGSSPPEPEGGPPVQPGAQKGKTSPGSVQPPADTPNQIRPADAELTKVTNDAVAYIRGLAELRHRNADWAERAVREAASLSASAALEQNVVDLMANDLDELLAKADGRTVEVLGQPRRIESANATVIALEPNWRIRLLATLADPNIAYILLLVGLYGLIFEFSNPGMYAPGVIGSISLVLGLMGLSVLPIAMAGLGLTLLGIALMAAEAFVPSFGALGIGGAVAFFIGSLMTFDTPGYRLAWPVVAGATVVSAGLFVLVLTMLLRSRRRPVSGGDAWLAGASGKVIAWREGEGQVEALGERWHARADRPLTAGQRVRVVGRQGLTLKVEPNGPGQAKPGEKP